MGKSILPPPIKELISFLKSLPGIGQRTAERLALKMITWEPERLHAFGSLLQEIPLSISKCPECGNLSCNNALCQLCDDLSRENNTICVVENFIQLQSIEQSGYYKGLYHVLGGKISPLNGIGPENLFINQLINRIAKIQPDEIIIALNADIEGQATTSYLKEKLSALNVKVSSLAQGIPAGADLSYADGATLTAAFRGRNKLN